MSITYSFDPNKKKSTRINFYNDRDRNIIKHSTTFSVPYSRELYKNLYDRHEVIYNDFDSLPNGFNLLPLNEQMSVYKLRTIQKQEWESVGLQNILNNEKKL